MKGTLKITMELVHDEGDETFSISRKVYPVNAKRFLWRISNTLEAAISGAYTLLPDESFPVSEGEQHG